MQVVTRDDGGIAGMPGGQTPGLQDDRRSDGCLSNKNYF